MELRFVKDGPGSADTQRQQLMNNPGAPARYLATNHIHRHDLWHGNHWVFTMRLNGKLIVMMLLVEPKIIRRRGGQRWAAAVEDCVLFAFNESKRMRNGTTVPRWNEWVLILFMPYYSNGITVTPIKKGVKATSLLRDNYALLNGEWPAKQRVLTTTI